MAGTGSSCNAFRGDWTEVTKALSHECAILLRSNSSLFPTAGEPDPQRFPARPPSERAVQVFRGPLQSDKGAIASGDRMGVGHDNQSVSWSCSIFEAANFRTTSRNSRWKKYPRMAERSEHLTSESGVLAIQHCEYPAWRTNALWPTVSGSIPA